MLKTFESYGSVILNSFQDITCLREAAAAKAGQIGPRGEVLNRLQHDGLLGSIEDVRDKFSVFLG